MLKNSGSISNNSTTVTIKNMKYQIKLKYFYSLFGSNWHFILITLDFSGTFFTISFVSFCLFVRRASPYFFFIHIYFNVKL